MGLAEDRKPYNQPSAEEMQLIRPTSEFEVGHLPFQGKVKLP
ncbi:MULTISPECIES: hypothetical protein [Dialister]|nr:hypothetical protein [Dialister massiliensis]HJI41898.1 hypothetical protein [Veillonellaceae bacterium]